MLLNSEGVDSPCSLKTCDIHSKLKLIIFSSGATLLRRVSVKPNGKLTVAIETSAFTHDVTGGVWEKLRTASNIVLISEGQTRVFVGNIMSEAIAYSVCVLGVLENERGTEIVGES